MKNKIKNSLLYTFGILSILSFVLVGSSYAKISLDNTLTGVAYADATPIGAGGTSGGIGGTSGGVGGTSGGVSGTGNTSAEFAKLKSPLKADVDLGKLINTALDLLLTIASIGAVLYIIYIGFEYVMSKGNDKKVSELHSKFLWAAVGIGIIFSAKLIAYIIFSTIQKLQ